MQLSIKFLHGLGDAVNFAQALPCFLSRGYRVEIECTPDKRIIFERAGAKITERGELTCTFPHAPADQESQAAAPWLGNKLAWGSFAKPLPFIGPIEELWGEMLASDLTIRDQQFDFHQQRLSALLAKCPRPWVCLHTRGNSNPRRVNVWPEGERELYFHLLQRLPGTIILLDWDSRVEKMNHYRVRNMEDSLGRLDIGGLVALLEMSDLFIGVDSGPLHLARTVETPSIGLWFNHYPQNFVLPSPLQFHLVDTAFEKRDRISRIPFNTEVVDLAGNLGTVVAERAARMLGGPRYLNPFNPAPDMQLQAFVRKTASRVTALGGVADRSGTFDLALRSLGHKAAPQIIETGCVRMAEDWAGAGYSTYIWAALARVKGGTITVYDNHESHLVTAKTLLRGNDRMIIWREKDSVQGLREHPGKADLVYLDSMDTDYPGHQDHCLAEATAAAQIAEENGRILIDDSPWYAGEWTGKGGKAIPYLLANGWRVERADYQCLLRRQKATPVE